MIREFDRVALTDDLPEHGLKSGDIATVVDIHTNPPGYELEVFTLDGKTLAVVSAYAHQVRPLGKREVAQARALELA
jgi:hypothetical protein